MRKFALLLGMTLMTAPAYADITHRMSSSVQLTVDAAASQATRIGSSYSASGNNIEVTTMGGLTTITSGVAPTLPAFGTVTTTAGGVAGTLAGTIDSQTGMAITAGGAGTSATGQFVTEILVK